MQQVSGPRTFCLGDTLGNYPALGRATQEAIPGAQLVELEGVGHLPHIEAYDQFWPALSKFLEQER